ncbi:MAG: zinc-binding alcohol dehydrogenase family protein [Caulobacter sp.]|nr:zinc-binding alcohol dehydrogenase family protein [Caulobacter sp.]
MKAAVYYETGAPDVFRYEDVPDPVCHPQGVVIRVEAVSIEGGDTLNRGGGQMAGSPHIVGYQAAGEIVEVGAEVSHLKVGQKVVTVNAFGSHAELRAVPARNAWPIPDGFDIQKASAIPVPFGTAHECLFGAGRLKAGETVLVQAGAGAVGLAAIQLAKKAGAAVLASASSDARLERLKAFGMDHGINYSRDDLVEQVMGLTGGKGVDLVVDPVGGATLAGSLGALGYRGRVSLVGNAGREPMKVDVSSLMAGNRSLTGVFLGAEIMTDRVHDMIQDLIEQAARGELKVLIDRTFPLSEAAAAHAYIESRQAVGGVLLIP